MLIMSDASNTDNWSRYNKTNTIQSPKVTQPSWLRVFTRGTTSNTPCQRLSVLLFSPEEGGFTKHTLRQTDSTVSCHSSLGIVVAPQTRHTDTFLLWGWKIVLLWNIPYLVLKNNLKVASSSRHCVLGLAAVSWRQINLAFVYLSIQSNHDGTWKVLDWVDGEGWFLLNVSFTHACVITKLIDTLYGYHILTFTPCGLDLRKLQ